MSSSVTARREKVQEFNFREIHPLLSFGTASDRFAGWIGTIYDPGWENDVITRRKRSGSREVTERILPIESVEEYFNHFSVLELDFTFYRPLFDADGRPSANYATLEKYASSAPAGARFFVKLPQAFTARKLRRSRGDTTFYDVNPSYLDAESCRIQFLEPLHSLLGNRVVGLLFQQEYQRAGEVDPTNHVSDLADFVGSLDSPYPLHLEIRSQHLLTDEYFAWLRQSGTGYVFSHWTWLPPLKQQWFQCGRKFFAESGDVFVRLLNPRDMTYQEAFQYAFPFEGPAPELVNLAQTRTMIDETVALIYRAIQEEKRVHVILNNRAYGSSPHLGQAVANRFLDFANRYSV